MTTERKSNLIVVSEIDNQSGDYVVLYMPPQEKTGTIYSEIYDVNADGSHQGVGTPGNEPEIRWIAIDPPSPYYEVDVLCTPYGMLFFGSRGVDQEIRWKWAKDKNYSQRLAPVSSGDKVRITTKDNKVTFTKVTDD